MRQNIFATLMLSLLGTNVACNTVHGLGQDVERAGEKTQDAADAVKKTLFIVPIDKNPLSYAPLSGPAA